MEGNYVKLYAGNLPWSVTDTDVQNLFNDIGPVQSAQVIIDRDSGRSRGFGFVQMEQSDATQSCVSPGLARRIRVLYAAATT